MGPPISCYKTQPQVSMGLDSMSFKFGTKYMLKQKKNNIIPLMDYNTV